MPRLSSNPPRYCHHKASGRAVVYLNGKAHYLGLHNSSESKAQYRQFIGEWSAKADPDQPSGASKTVSSVLTIAEALMQYRSHCQRYYQSRELDNLRDALRPLREQFGKLQLASFGPMQIRMLRDRWIERGLARSTINSRVKRIRRFFRWCVSFELADTKILTRLETVEPIMPGRGGRETVAKGPVAWEVVELTLPHLPELVQAMVLFGWFTGARPSEITGLTSGAVDQSGDVWIARLKRHKNSHRGLSREIAIGKSAQACLMPWLRPEAPDEPVFSPLRVDPRQKKRKGSRRPGAAYCRCSFAQSIRRACARAKIPSWSPNALRHSFATRLRDIGGIEASQVALGHQKPDTTLIYTTAAKARMLDAIREAG
jgi:integrase